MHTLMVEMFLHIIFFTTCNCIDIGLIFLIYFYAQQIDVICQFRDSKIIASFDYLLLEYFFSNFDKRANYNKDKFFTLTYILFLML